MALSGRSRISPDRRRVITGTCDRNVKVWNLEDGEQEGTSMEHANEVCGLAVTRDGTKIISSDDGGGIKVWDVESHEIVKKWTHPKRGPKIAISPDDRLIAVAESEENVAILRLWLFTPWKGDRSTIPSVDGMVDLSPGYGVWSMSFSPDGKKLACGTYDGDIRAYDVNSGTLILEAHQDWIRDVLWSRDGSRLFSASDDPHDKTIRCWNTDTGEQIGHPWTGHTDYCIRSLSLSPGGSILASASRDRTVRFWDATTGNPIRQHLQHEGVEAVAAVRFSPSGNFVVSVGGGKIYLWRVPWLNSIKHQVITSFRRTSVFILIALSMSC